MTRDQLEIRAMRMILDKCNLRNLPAVSKSFYEIANMSRIYIDDTDLRVVPECINLLTGLRQLDLWRCKLNRDDSFPDTFWQLTGLEGLGLSDNELTSIPSQIGQLSSLTGLILGYNNLVSLPDEIYQLTNLTQLYLFNNKLESISEKIGKLTNLTKLYVSSNQLTKLPKSIGNLVNLANNDGLFLYCNPLTSLPDSIRKVKHTLNKDNKTEYKLLLEDVETRAAQRLQRRLLILLAKAPILQKFISTTHTHKSSSVITVETITTETKTGVVYDVLTDPKLAKMICQYIDYN